MSKKKNKPTPNFRSSAAEYLTFIAATGDNEQSVEMRYEDENVWLTQKMLATLYDVEVNTINYHIKKIFEDAELEESATIRKFRIVQTEGNRKVSREVEHYGLQMVMSVGFKVNSERATQFRKWVGQIAKDYTIQGWVMDVPRLKQSGTILTKEYFEKQLEKIREIRLSERRFYQKITDLYATSIDYDKSASTTKRFYATVQNKLHWAIHQHTAAELIVSRANHQKENMGLSTWEAAPEGKIQKSDVSIAKNYLTQNEMASLERIVSAYLDLAEDFTLRGIPMTMQDWEIRLNKFLEFNEREILDNPGKVTHEIAQAFAESEFEKYRIVQDKLYQSDFDKLLEQTKILIP
ncbi:MAG: virulence RhuM family protein [Ferruginibacter sp.]|nr:virulence RhuM family protein [Ferruginibacter sp.]